MLVAKWKDSLLTFRNASFHQLFLFAFSFFLPLLLSLVFAVCPPPDGPATRNNRGHYQPYPLLSLFASLLGRRKLEVAFASKCRPPWHRRLEIRRIHFKLSFGFTKATDLGFLFFPERATNPSMQQQASRSIGKDQLNAVWKLGSNLCPFVRQKLPAHFTVIAIKSYSFRYLRHHGQADWEQTATAGTEKH